VDPEIASKGLVVPSGHFHARRRSVELCLRARHDTAWFVPTEFACPDPDTETGDFLGLARRFPIGCYGTSEVTFTAWYPELPDDAGLGGSCDADASVAWLYCANITYDHVLTSPQGAVGYQTLFVEPETGVTLPERGQWLRIAGAFDHPDAALCAAEMTERDESALAVLECRSHLVVRSVEVTTTRSAAGARRLRLRSLAQRAKRRRDMDCRPV